MFSRIVSEFRGAPIQATVAIITLGTIAYTAIRALVGQSVLPQPDVAFPLGLDKTIATSLFVGAVFGLVVALVVRWRPALGTFVALGLMLAIAEQTAWMAVSYQRPGTISGAYVLAGSAMFIFFGLYVEALYSSVWAKNNHGPAAATMMVMLVAAGLIFGTLFPQRYDEHWNLRMVTLTTPQTR